MPEFLNHYKFTDTTQRDRVIDEAYSLRECMDTPGMYRLPNGGTLQIILDEAWEYAPEQPDVMTSDGRREVAIKLLCNWFDHRYIAHVLKAHIPLVAVESQKQADEAMEEILELMGVDS